jgi:hypothetical protein
MKKTINLHNRMAKKGQEYKYIKKTARVVVRVTPTQKAIAKHHKERFADDVRALIDSYIQ